MSFQTGKISSEMEIKNFPRHQPCWGQGLSSSDELCIPEPGHYLAMPFKFKSCIDS